MMRFIALLIILFMPLIALSDLLYVKGSGTLEIYSKHDILSDYESVGYEQKVVKIDGNYLVRVSSSISSSNIPSGRFVFNPGDYDDKYIISLARKITDGSVYLNQAVECLVFWLRNNIRYNAGLMTRKPTSIREILAEKEGTCVDIIFVLSELFDACGIRHNIIRGMVIDNHSIVLHRWIEFDNGKGQFIQLDPLASLYFVTPNYLFIKKDNRYSKSYYDFPIKEKLQEIRILNNDYNFTPIDKKCYNGLDILIAAHNKRTNKNGIVISDRENNYKEILITGNDAIYRLRRDRILTYSIFGLESGRYEIFYLHEAGKSHLKTVFLKDREIHFAGK